MQVHVILNLISDTGENIGHHRFTVLHFLGKKFFNEVIRQTCYKYYRNPEVLRAYYALDSFDGSDTLIYIVDLYKAYLQEEYRCLTRISQENFFVGLQQEIINDLCTVEVKEFV